jgi:hypothetical protein
MQDVLPQSISDVDVGALLFQHANGFGIVVKVGELNGVNLQGVILIVNYLLLVFYALQEDTEALGIVFV